MPKFLLRREIRKQQDIQCTHDVTWRRVRTYIVTVGKEYELHIIVCITALGIQHALCMHHIVICGLPGSAIFFHVISYRARFSKKKKVIEHKVCVFVFSTTISDTFLILRIT